MYLLSVKFRLVKLTTTLQYESLEKFRNGTCSFNDVPSQCVFIELWVLNIFPLAATNPEKKKSAKAEHGFKVTSDGRLIIKEEDDEDDQKGSSQSFTICKHPEMVN